MTKVFDNEVQPEPIIPIRTVCAMYGLNPNTLRTWERRYSIIQPKRGEGGHRGYSPRDVATIERMLRLINSGMQPSSAADQIKTSPAPATETPAVPVNGQFAKVHTELGKAIQNMDLARANDICRDAESRLGYTAMMENVMFPELRHRGNEWEKTRVGVAQEHVASFVARTMIMDYNRRALPNAKGPVVLLACVPDEQHEMSIVHLANLLCDTGKLEPVLLAAGLPMQEIVTTAAIVNPEAIILSATITPPSSSVREWMDLLAAQGLEEKTILVGSGFERSRVFSERKVRAGAGSYMHLVAYLQNTFAKNGHN